MNLPLSIKGIDFDFEVSLCFDFSYEGDESIPSADVNLSAIYMDGNKINPNRFINIYSFVDEVVKDLDLTDQQNEYFLNVLPFFGDFD